MSVEVVGAALRAGGRVVPVVVVEVREAGLDGVLGETLVRTVSICAACSRSFEPDSLTPVMLVIVICGAPSISSGPRPGMMAEKLVW